MVSTILISGWVNLQDWTTGILDWNTGLTQTGKKNASISADR